MIKETVAKVQDKIRNIPVISLQSMSERTVHHVLCYSGHSTTRAVKDNTIESHNVRMVQVGKVASLIPKVISLIISKNNNPEN